MKISLVVHLYNHHTNTGCVMEVGIGAVQQSVSAVFGCRLLASFLLPIVGSIKGFTVFCILSNLSFAILFIFFTCLAADFLLL